MYLLFRKALKVKIRQNAKCGFSWLLALLFGLVTATCSLAATTDDEVVIQLKWLHQFQFAGYYAALEQGYFAEEGLKVTLRERGPAHTAVREVLDGNAKYGVSDSVLLLHHARGDPVVIVAAIMQHSANAIITMADSRLEQPRDLAGRRVALHENDADGIDILALLAEQGIPQGAFTRRSWDARVGGLISGDVDAISIYVTNEPFVLQELGHELNIISPRHYGFDFYGDMLFTTQDEAEQRPERVAAIRRAVLRGWTYALDHKSEMVELIYQRYNTQNKSRAALTAEALGMATLISRHTTPLGQLNAGRMEFILTQINRLDLTGPIPPRQADLIFPATDPGERLLTAEERDFLDSLGPIRFPAEEAGWAPFEYFNAQGQFRGIASDYLAELERILDVRFELVRGMSWQQIMQAARNRDVDLLPAATSTPDRRAFLRFTTPYVRSPMIIATRNDVDFIANLEQLRDEAVGVVSGYTSDELLGRYHPTLRLSRYPSTIDGLRAVASGNDFAFIDNLAATTHIIKAEGLANLKISGQTPYSFDLSIAVRSDWPLLHSAIEKALASMSAQQHEAIYDRWVQLEIDAAFPWKRALPAMLAAGFAILLLLAYVLRLRSFNARLARAELELQHKNSLLHEASITDKLTRAYNRHQLDAVLQEQFERATRYRRALSLILFDLDHFKQVNDDFGHQAGDVVLKRFAETVNACIRSSDIFGRWGGEEFMLICPETDVAQAAVVAEKIRGAFMAEHFEPGLTPTVSAGVVDNRNIRNTDHFISSADEQLYAAKLAGRNRVMSANAPSDDGN